MKAKNILLLLVAICLSISISSVPLNKECVTEKSCKKHEKCVNGFCFHKNEHVFECNTKKDCPDYHICMKHVCLIDTTRKN
ncbi:unnamed protein product [Caenorhabditis angaria]|uniref:Uncharacterized protein n=1 Tax=Caenorhabditis angaria TaxID=860376 RepID=A0A9P1MZR4_9PELO|nr:unnamed protein product [Caenorhabditis angaria]